MNQNLIQINLEVNGLPRSVRPGSTVFQACEQAGVEIPRFCYHERLLVAGNCRICLVEIVGSPKPQASCAIPVNPGMKVFTDSPRVKKARELVIEFLLLNHPLDCPICDQGGECDRQDESITFGLDRGRGKNNTSLITMVANGYEPKRSVEERDWNPRVKAIMTRCIHCTRCIRFASEVAGVSDRGTSARGVSTEVGTYVHKPRITELSGNLVDLCPVGALTSKTYGFKARPWELKSIDTQNRRDGSGSEVRIQSRDQGLLRILPIENDVLNGSWIDDKSRYSRDGNDKNVRTNCLTHKENGERKSISYDYGIELFSKSVESSIVNSNKEEIVFVVHSGLPLEAQYSIYDMGNKLRSLGGKVSILSTEASEIPADIDHIIIGSKAGLDDLGKADFVLTIGVDRRSEAPLVNARLRESYLRDKVEIVSWGNKQELTYPVNHIGSNPSALKDFINGENGKANRLQGMRSAKCPLIILGSQLDNEVNSCVSKIVSILSLLKTSQNGWKLIYPIYASASSVGSRIIGFDSLSSYFSNNSSMKLNLITIGLDKADIENSNIISSICKGEVNISSFTYFGYYFDPRVNLANVSIPLPSWYGLNGLRMNAYGQVKTIRPAMGSGNTNNSESRNSNGILMSSSNFIPTWRNESVRNSNRHSNKDMFNTNLGKQISGYRVIENISPTPSIHDYYIEGHPVVRRSSRMQECSLKLNKNQNFTN